MIGSLLILCSIAVADLQAKDGFSLPLSLTTAVAGAEVEVEVRFAGAKSEVAALAFVLDYDETRLALDPAPSGGNHKSVQVELPSDFASSIFFLSNAGGEVGLSIYDPTAPVSNLPDGPLARFRFRILSNASGFAAVRISDALSPNASDRFGNSVNSFVPTSTGGVMITALRPQVEPSDRSLDFGTVPVDAVVERQLILSNVGTAASLIESIRLESDSGEFELSAGPGLATLAPGAGLALNVRFLSRQSGTYLGRLVIDIASPHPSPIVIPIRATSAPDGNFSYDRRMLLPVVARVPGSGGSQWRTDLTLLNKGAFLASLRLQYLGAAGMERVVEVRLEPGESKYYDDVAAEVFGDTRVSSALTILSSSADIAASSSTYNLLADGGSIGQAVPLLDWPALLRSGQPAYLVGLERTSRRRTRIGLLNLSQHVAEFRATLRRGDGTAIHERVYSLEPSSLLASLDLFDGLAAEEKNLVVIVEAVTPDTTFYVYASTVDNRTGGPVFQTPR